jgi:hypothetical protein
LKVRIFRVRRLGLLLARHREFLDRGQHGHMRWFDPINDVE